MSPSPAPTTPPVTIGDQRPTLDPVEEEVLVEEELLVEEISIDGMCGVY